MIFSWLAAAFIIMPIIELTLLIRVGQAIGPLSTISIVILTGLAGAYFARQQGLQVMMLIQRDMREGRMPAPRLMDGVMILIAGILMITPGLITDCMGLLLLMPPVRFQIRMYMKKKIEEKFRNGSIVINVNDENIHDQWLDD